MIHILICHPSTQLIVSALNMRSAEDWAIHMFGEGLNTFKRSTSISFSIFSMHNGTRILCKCKSGNYVPTQAKKSKTWPPACFFTLTVYPIWQRQRKSFVLDIPHTESENHAIPAQPIWQRVSFMLDIPIR